MAIDPVRGVIECWEMSHIKAETKILIYKLVLFAKIYVLSLHKKLKTWEDKMPHPVHIYSSCLLSFPCFLYQDCFCDFPIHRLGEEKTGVPQLVNVLWVFNCLGHEVLV